MQTVTLIKTRTTNPSPATARRWRNRAAEAIDHYFGAHARRIGGPHRTVAIAYAAFDLLVASGMTRDDASYIVARVNVSRATVTYAAALAELRNGTTLTHEEMSADYERNGHRYH